MVDQLLSQGCRSLWLEKSFDKFYGRYQDLIEKYQRSLKEIVNGSFPELSSVDIQRNFSWAFLLHYTLICHMDLLMLLSDC